MERLSEFTQSKAEWIQPKTLERFYELRSGAARLASLAFRSSFGTLAVAETAEGRWTFKRVGFLNPRVTVRVAGEQDDVAIYHPKLWGDGVLIFDEGISLTWQPVNFWRTEWVFTNSAGRLLMRFYLGRENEKLRDLFKTQATVEILSADASRHLFPVLAPLGLYLLIIHREDAAATAAATTAAFA